MSEKSSKKDKIRKIIDKTEKLLIFFLPLAVFFSYHPVIRLGSSESMNFELSICLIILALLGILSIRKIPEIWRKADKRLLLSSALIPLYMCISLLWSANKVRGSLSCAITLLLFVFAWRVVSLTVLNKVEFRKFIRFYLFSAVAMGSFGLIQCALNLIFPEVENQKLLLCPGCGYQSLGFPHPNAFAIEPQFFGNLLLAPCLISLFIFYNKINSNNSKHECFSSGLLLFYLSMCLYIVFSRGALYSFCLMAGIFIVAKVLQDKKIKDFLPAIIISLAFGVAVSLQGIMTMLAPIHDSFFDGVARSISQFSLGIIDFTKDNVKEEDALITTPTEAQNKAQNEAAVTESETTQEPAIKTENKLEKSEEEVIFDGYVEESTSVRLELNEAAFRSWKKHVLFGVGIGGAGVAISLEDEHFSPKEIVQNEFFSLLLELGLVGIIILAVNVFIFGRLMIQKHKMRSLIIILGYLVSLNFFSGVANAAHIYLTTPLLAKGERA